MDVPRLTAALETSLLRQLLLTWHELNGNHFRARMKPPVIALHDGMARLGFWSGEPRRLSLSSELALGQPWAVVREVLKHEMAHQYVEEVMGIRDEAAHGPSFEALCRRLGIDASSAGLPRPGPDVGATETAPESAVLRRIRKLLALAESPNQHEAELAMQQAQRLMLQHNIAEVTAAAAAGFAFRQLGAPRGRIDAHEHMLAAILSTHFFVEAIWVPSYSPLEGRSGRVVELCGTPSNLDVATYVHEFLTATGERLWREHKRANGISGDRERRRFLLGVMIGFGEKLKSGVAESRREGLIWTGDPALQDYLRSRYPRRSGGGQIRYQRTEAYEHGRAAGRGIVLHRPVGSGGGTRSPRLLTDR